MNKQTALHYNRIDWVDYAKGICIVAVVIFYATSNVEASLNATGWMHYLVAFAQPFRMPDFFLISGLFVSRVIDRPLRAYIDTKVLHFFYFYILWITIRLLVQDGIGLLGPHWRTILTGYFKLYIQPHGQLWFIYLLPIFFIVVRMFRWVSPALLIAFAVFLKLAEIDTGWKLIDRFCMYFVFFYSGHIFSLHIFSVANWARENIRKALLILAAWFIANGLMVILNLSYLPGMQLLMGYAGAAAILLLSSLLTLVPWMKWLRYLGQQSIVIYLAFVIPMAIMRAIIIKYQIISDVGTISLIVIAASIAGSLALNWMVSGTRMRFLFNRPEWASMKISRFQMTEKGA